LEIRTKSDKWSDEMYDILEVNKDKVTPSRELILLFIHPDDVDAARMEMEESLKIFHDSVSNFRFIRKDSSIRYGYVKAMFDLDVHRAPARVFGIFQDVTVAMLGAYEKKYASRNPAMVIKA